MEVGEQPGGRRPAPAGLALVQAFLNSVDLEDGPEAFDSPAALRAWLAGHGLLAGDAALDVTDLRRAVETREALRALALANNGAPLDPDAVAALNRAARRAPLRVQVVADGRPDLAPGAGGLDGALASILAAVYDAAVDGTWPRLKACRNDVCRWAFYDHSKNRSGAWCSMAICGGQAKTRAYRRRHGTGGS